MRYGLGFTILATMLLGVVVPAKADTDQRCLSLCINNGGAASTCMPQCTYNETPHDAGASKINTLSPHDVLQAPTPAEGVLLLPTHKAAAPIADKDYVCLNQCLQDGGQYDRCSKTCTKTGCTIGSGACSDLVGKAGGAAPDGPTTPPIPH
jgi:hypothetical protein